MNKPYSENCAISLTKYYIIQIINAAMPDSLHQKEENGLLWPCHQAQHGTYMHYIIKENRRQAQQGKTKNYADGQHNIMIRSGLRGGNKEGTRL